MEFSLRLKQLRSEKGVSQRELAEQIHVSRSAVAKWENGLGLPGEDSAPGWLAEYFGLSEEELLPERGAQSKLVEKNRLISRPAQGYPVPCRRIGAGPGGRDGMAVSALPGLCRPLLPGRPDYCAGGVQPAGQYRHHPLVSAPQGEQGGPAALLPADGGWAPSSAGPGCLCLPCWPPCLGRGGASMPPSRGFSRGWP